MYRVRTGRCGVADGPERIFREDADPHGLVIGRCEVADESETEKRKFEFYEDSDDSVVIFR